MEGISSTLLHITPAIKYLNIVIPAKAGIQVDPGRKWPKRPSPPDRTARTGQVRRSSIGDNPYGLRFVQLNPPWIDRLSPPCSTHNCCKAVHRRHGFYKDFPKRIRGSMNSSVTNLHLYRLPGCEWPYSLNRMPNDLPDYPSGW